MGLFGNVIKPLQGKLTANQEERVKNKLKQKHHLSKHKQGVKRLPKKSNIKNSNIDCHPVTK